eukprot:TRINITY_DN1740_c0_g1_i15.p1 TRINITY_DN1740_c0_g1~~TRINITY_DN1740_c0_g1_i15.p1  ORF type:complete len:666 (-),score=201.57 TRINITY_DN1740_c0_g1_i15:130-2127(-)
MDEKRGEVRLRRPDSSEQAKEFTFDSVYDDKSRQEDIYVNSVFPVVENVLIGYNGTVFAYGQTGTGKTFTIEGYDNPPDMMGVMPRSFETIFSNIQCDNPEQRQYLVRASYMELYKEDIRDLLSPNPKAKLELHEKPDTGVYVKDLIMTVVTSVQELKKIQMIGRKNRTTAETKMNDHSSRSHAIFTITIETSEPGVDGKPRIRAGKFHLVDLAGSERQSKTEAVGERLEEATKINLSLSTLCHVISSLVDSRSSFTPYRNSKLTRLLQDSLGGNTKTVMIANIGPADYNYDETLNTLRYASRAKHITNKPRINEDPKDAMIREFQNEIERLKAELAQIDRDSSVAPDMLLNQLANIGNMGGAKLSQDRLKELAEESKARAREVEARKVSIKQTTQEVATEKQKILENLRKHEEQSQKEMRDRNELKRQLGRKELQLHLHNENVEREKKRKLLEDQQMQAALEEKKIKQRRLAESLKQKKEETIALQQKFATQKEEIEVKDKILHRLWKKLQAIRTKTREMEEFFWSEREETMNRICDYNREAKLLDLIIKNFVPNEKQMEIKECAHWDDENEAYKLMLPEPNTDLKVKKEPVPEQGQVVETSSQDLRPKCENILLLELDVTKRTTEDYTGTQESSRVKNTFHNILVDNKDDFEYNAVYFFFLIH